MFKFIRKKIYQLEKKIEKDKCVKWYNLYFEDNINKKEHDIDSVMDLIYNHYERKICKEKGYVYNEKKKSKKNYWYNEKLNLKYNVNSNENTSFTTSYLSFLSLIMTVVVCFISLISTNTDTFMSEEAYLYKTQIINSLTKIAFVILILVILTCIFSESMVSRRAFNQMCLDIFEEVEKDLEKSKNNRQIDTKDKLNSKKNSK